MEIKTLSIQIDDRRESFTDQLEDIISAINEGVTSGYGWSIEEE